MPGITVQDYFADLSGTHIPVEWKKYFIPKDRRDLVFEFLFHLQALEAQKGMEEQ